MTREAVKVELTGGDGHCRRFAKGASALVKGQLLSLFDARTASGTLGGTTGTAKPAAGIAAEDAASGTTEISVWTDGIFDMYCSGTIACGSPVVFLNDNYVGGLPGASGAVNVGYAMEDGSANEQINVRIML